MNPIHTAAKQRDTLIVIVDLLMPMPLSILLINQILFLRMHNISFMPIKRRKTDTHSVFYIVILS